MKNLSRLALLFVFAFICMHKSVIWAGEAPIIIHVQPLKQTVKAGDPVAWYVMATGEGKLEYQWSLNGKPIANANSKTLQLSSVGSREQGFYTCTVKNQFGAETTDRLSLTVRPTALVNSGTKKQTSQSLGAAR